MEFKDILYDKQDAASLTGAAPDALGKVAWITINRPDVMNAFTAVTVWEMVQALDDAWNDEDVGVVVLRGAGERAFTTGGDRRGAKGGPRMDLVRLFSMVRRIPKPVIAMVQGYAIGGGHVLHVVCDLTIASEKARFGQVGPKFGSVDPGFGTAYLARVVGEKKAREIWYFCEQYSAQQALTMGLVNWVVPHEELLAETERKCAALLEKSPGALKIAKQSFNADTQHIEGLTDIGFTALYGYLATEEAQEGRAAFLEKRKPQFRKRKG